MNETAHRWLVYASIVLIVAGIMRILDSIWAFRYNGNLPENLGGGVLGTNLTTYAVIYLIVGIVLIVAGIYVLSLNQFFRWVGIVAGIIAVISGAVWLPFYPLWAAVYIAGGSVIVYALVVHGEAETARQ